MPTPALHPAQPDPSDAPLAGVRIGAAWLVPLADHALWWPARRALLVADLHLEKGSCFARFGQLLPPYDTQDTLDRLARLVDVLGAVEVWCLGDSLHDGGAAERMEADCLYALRRLTSAVEWTWITGNHDPEIDFALGGRSTAEALVDGLVLRHEAHAGECRPELSGHFHPKLKVRARGATVARRCFARCGDRMILPAFGAYAGGLDVTALPRLVGATGAWEALVVTAQGLRRFPFAT